MPRPIRRSPSPVTGLASLPDIKFTQREVDAVVTNTTKSVADKMGITVAKLPTDIKTAIRKSAISALNIRTKAIIQRDTDTVVKNKVLTGVKPLDLLDARMKAAKVGIGHIAADTKVEAVLADTAKLLWKKFKALINAGFSNTQAFDLLLAEVQGRASRSRRREL